MSNIELKGHGIHREWVIELKEKCRLLFMKFEFDGNCFMDKFELRNKSDFKIEKIIMDDVCLESMENEKFQNTVKIWIKDAVGKISLPFHFRYLKPEYGKHYKDIYIKYPTVGNVDNIETILEQQEPTLSVELPVGDLSFKKYADLLLVSTIWVSAGIILKNISPISNLLE